MAPKTNALKKTINELQHITYYEEEKERLEAIYADRQEKVVKAKRAVVEAETRAAERLANHKLQKADLKFKRAKDDVDECLRRLRCHYGRLHKLPDVQINTPALVKVICKMLEQRFTGKVWVREDARRYEAIMRAASRKNVMVMVIRR
ncbi:hypothetical protein OROGR_004505 [Orobanche gracilis]